MNAFFSESDMIVLKDSSYERRRVGEIRSKGRSDAGAKAKAGEERDENTNKKDGWIIRNARRSIFDEARIDGL